MVTMMWWVWLAIAPTALATVEHVHASDVVSHGDQHEPTVRAHSTPTVIPTVALGLARTPETLTLSLADGEQRDTRSVWHSGFRAGVGYHLPDRWLPLGQLRGHTGLALELVLADGRLPLGLTQAAQWELPLTGELAVSAGASAAVHVDFGDLGLAAVDLGLPLGVRWGWVELLYTPRVVVPLASAREEVFAGTRSRHTGTGLALLHVSLRLHLGTPRWR